ncbi:hypothetical protein KUTeg_020223 [Tegillarca granosa]|uniref:FAS1 domain-containing protein n=1 Tax=Tegillarca granosa TaxID=220873 RepID=A0ABQ9E775_TEGGR|nr:hypothetical protein KUTeg_020223 [Tegillarca granosa]
MDYRNDVVICSCKETAFDKGKAEKSSFIKLLNDVEESKVENIQRVTRRKDPNLSFSLKSIDLFLIIHFCLDFKICASVFMQNFYMHLPKDGQNKKKKVHRHVPSNKPQEKIKNNNITYISKQTGANNQHYDSISGFNSVVMISSIFLIAVGLPNLIYAQKNIVDLATELGATELVSFIKAAGLDEALSGTGPFTVFAPTNDAFTALPSDVVEKLKSDKQLLSDTLKYHVHNGRVYSSELKNDLTASTLDDLNEIRINLYGKVATVNGAKIDKVNQNATNGVIHVIEKVLYPVPTLNLVQLIGTTKDFSTLLYCIIRANIEGQLADDKC